jgi:hypothetical protein
VNPMKKFLVPSLLLLPFGLSACNRESTPEEKDRQAVQAQQSQYAAGQPVPTYDWSLERDLLIQLYNLRNQKVATHAVWRSDYGTIEGDCPSIGFGLPYDTSLTNPLQAEYRSRHQAVSGVAIGQAEPNGIFASTNTAATWVMCAGDAGVMMPVYVEAKVTVYPYPVEVDYENNRVVRAGQGQAVTIEATK